MIGRRAGGESRCDGKIGTEAYPVGTCLYVAVRGRDTSPSMTCRHLRHHDPFRHVTACSFVPLSWLLTEVMGGSHSHDFSQVLIVGGVTIFYGIKSTKKTSSLSTASTASFVVGEHGEYGEYVPASFVGGKFCSFSFSSRTKPMVLLYEEQINTRHDLLCSVGARPAEVLLLIWWCTR